MLTKIYFNPRFRMGSDHEVPCGLEPSVISIHAPAWGATMMACMVSEVEGFQSTLPHGERPLPMSCLLA